MEFSKKSPFYKSMEDNVALFENIKAMSLERFLI